MVFGIVSVASLLFQQGGVESTRDGCFLSWQYAHNLTRLEIKFDTVNNVMSVKLSIVSL